MELSASGKHAKPARSSKSKSPEVVAHSTRAPRGSKGLKKPPEPIEEATQESSPHGKESRRGEQVIGNDEAVDDDTNNQVGEEPADVEAERDDEVEDFEVIGDSAKENADEDEDVQMQVDDRAAEDDDDDDGPVTRRTRGSRPSISAPIEDADDESEKNGGKAADLGSCVEARRKQPRK